MKVLAQGETIKIQFQPMQSHTPEGFLADYGEVFGVKNNYAYGWTTDHTNSTVTRATYDDLQNKFNMSQSSYGNPTLDTLTLMHPDGMWEIQLDNGIYEVAVTVGDSVYGSKNALDVEGTIFWDGLSLDPGEHSTLKKSVTVRDGKLSLSQINSPNVETALNNIEISMVNMFTPTLAQPRIALPAEENKIAGNKVLMSGTMVNVHNAPPFIKVKGLQGEISRYMNEQTDNIKLRIQQYEQTAFTVSGSDVTAIHQAVTSSLHSPAIIKAGHLNLEKSVTFGSPDKPVILILEGINTNQFLNITVYGTLILKGGLNANAALSLNILNGSSDESNGNLWVQGAFQLNNNLDFHVDNELFAGDLTYNSGTLNIEAKRVLVPGSLNINTNVIMNIEDEISIGVVISNNLVADLKVKKGDLFVRDSISVNNHLNITTGGLFAVGGDLITNQRPNIHTGYGTEGHTLLKYAVSGLKAEYFSGSDFTGQKVTKLDESIFLSGQPVLGVPGIADKRFSVSWTGQVQPNYSGEYTFFVNTNGGVKLWVNDQLLVDQWSARYNSAQRTIQLEAGMKYDLRMEYANDLGNPQASLLWESDKQIKEVVPSISLRPFAIPLPVASAVDTGITIQWPTLFNADGYEVEFDNNITSIGTEPYFSADSLNSGTEHIYRVRANSGDLKGEWSLATPHWTLPTVPQDINLTSTSNSITLTWSPVIGATSYEIEVNNSIQDIGNVLTYLENDLNPNMQKTFRVRAKNSSGVGGWSKIIAKSTTVGVPANLSGLAEENGIKVQWDAVSGAITYDLEVDGVVISSIKENDYSHNGLLPNSTHEYKVRANNENGTSLWSEKITVYTPPTIPGNLKAQVKGNSVHVSWDAVDGATEYEIEVDGALVNNQSNTVFTHTVLYLNSEHTYRVRAKNTNAIGSWSNLIVYTTHAGIPNNVQVTATSDEIIVTWDVVVGAIGYDIELDGAINYLDVDNIYIHSNLKPFSNHSYRVRARNAGGAGEWSRLVSGKTIFGKPLHLKANSQNTSIEISWDKVEGATGYDILVDGEILDNGAETSYKHIGLEPYSWHVYRVRGKYGDFLGEWSDPLTKSTVLGIPGNIKVQSLSDQILLSWDSVSGATGYEIEADGEIIDNGGKINFKHTGLLANTKHVYRIRAKNAQVLSEWSEWTSTFTGVTAPDVPKNLKASATINSIQLTWDSVEGATSYDLEVDGQIVTGNNITVYKQSGLEPNTMHIYRVRARNMDTFSDWSVQLKKITTPALKIQPEKDSQFNFVMIIPQKSDLVERLVTVTYNAEDLEVIDLRAETSDLEIQTGLIKGTAVSVTSFEPGRIVYKIQSNGKTVMNTIKFSALTNEFTKVTYVIE
ncbi:PA14 domain-containing protein [Paenibacillus sp. FSL R10-2796]|uniref:fibronectin type III domain-containing protein n=1 Tax=Paenibacillus sp. FSL R10-2796 TaxID=2954663 RepID=UPI0030D8370E